MSKRCPDGTKWNKTGNKCERYSSRGFSILDFKDGTSIHYGLEERESGFHWVKWKAEKGKTKTLDDKKISSSTRNWMWAERKAKELFRKDSAEAMKNKRYKSSYSSMWHEPNPKYFTQKDYDKWIEEGSY